MNDTIKDILSRRSTRHFESLQISADNLKIVLECGVNAPSALNTQNWYFCAIQNSELIAQLNSDIKNRLPAPAQEKMLSRNNGKADFNVFYGAPTVIVVAGEGGDKWSTINCALATENICIAAQSLGISTCIIGYAALLFSSGEADKYIDMLAIPSGYKPLYSICLGYSAAETPRITRAEGRFSIIK